MSSSSLSSSLINSSVDSLHLRQHQKKLIKRMLQPQTHHRQLFVAGTGSGKTTIATHLKQILLSQCVYIEGDSHHSDDNIKKMSNGIALNDQGK